MVSRSVFAVVCIAALAACSVSAQDVSFAITAGPQEGEVTLLYSSMIDVLGIQYELSGPLIFAAIREPILDDFIVVANGNTFIAFSLSAEVIPSTMGEFIPLAAVTFIGANPGTDEICVLSDSVYAIASSTSDQVPAIPSMMECAILPDEDVMSPPPPSPSPPPAAVLSDPHLHGLQGQEFDFTGEASKIYSLISDESLEVNALFGTAYATALTVDPETLIADQMQERGTWIREIGLVIGSNEVLVSVESSADDFMCPKVSPDQDNRDLSCFIGGSVTVNGESKVRVGEFVVDDSMSVTLNNFKSYSRVIVSSQDITVSIDYVPPPAHWNVPMESKDDYSHLNLRIDALALTQNANGVLGQTSRVNLDSNGKPVLKSSSANGNGVLVNKPEDFEVSSIFSTDSKVNQFSA